jgi:hypothetical protein
MAKVCKSHGQGTFAGTQGNGKVAPKAAARSARLYRQHATQDGPKAIPLVRRRAEEYYLPPTIDGWFDNRTARR